MNQQDFINQAKRAALDYMHGDASGIELFGKIAYEANLAKQKLREAGIGYIGLPLLETVKEIIRQRGEE